MEPRSRTGDRPHLDALVPPERVPGSGALGQAGPRDKGHRPTGAAPPPSRSTPRIDPPIASAFPPATTRPVEVVTPPRPRGVLRPAVLVPAAVVLVVAGAAIAAGTGAFRAPIAAVPATTPAVTAGTPAAAPAPAPASATPTPTPTQAGNVHTFVGRATNHRMEILRDTGALSPVDELVDPAHELTVDCSSGSCMLVQHRMAGYIYPVFYPLPLGDGSPGLYRFVQPRQGEPCSAPRTGNSGFRQEVTVLVNLTADALSVTVRSEPFTNECLIHVGDDYSFASTSVRSRLVATPIPLETPPPTQVPWQAERLGGPTPQPAAPKS